MKDDNEFDRRRFMAGAVGAAAIGLGLSKTGVVTGGESANDTFGVRRILATFKGAVEEESIVSFF